ncbi:MAG: pilus assembly protein PilM [Atopobiaceae bacterium]|jgi:type IV pilus assembly protein PilM|nr:pilus assembly protein PilM [Atopobiaceae bacterium]
MANSFVGIDVGNGSLKLAVREAGVHLVSNRLPENMVSSDDVVAPETMAEFLRGIRDKEQIKARDCAVVLAESNAYFRHVTLPAMTIEELKLNLPYEFRDYIDGDPTDYVYDYVVDQLVKDESGKPVRLELYAGLPRARTSSRTSATCSRKAGFRLKVVIPAQMAYANLMRGYVEANPADVDRNVVFVNIGFSNVSIALFQGARYQASRVIDLGCRDLDRAIADLKGIDRYTASSYKESNFEGVLDSVECQQVYDRICIEVNKVVNFYNFSNPDKDIEALYLLGGGAQIPQLASALGSAISVPIESVSKLLPIEAADQPNSPVCALAIAAMLEAEAM